MKPKIVDVETAQQQLHEWITDADLDELAAAYSELFFGDEIVAVRDGDTVSDSFQNGERV